MYINGAHTRHILRLVKVEGMQPSQNFNLNQHEHETVLLRAVEVTATAATAYATIPIVIYLCCVTFSTEMGT